MHYEAQILGQRLHTHVGHSLHTQHSTNILGHRSNKHIKSDLLLFPFYSLGHPRNTLEHAQGHSEGHYGTCHCTK